MGFVRCDDLKVKGLPDVAYSCIRPNELHASMPFETERWAKLLHQLMMGVALWPCPESFRIHCERWWPQHALCCYVFSSGWTYDRGGRRGSWWKPSRAQWHCLLCNAGLLSGTDINVDIFRLAVSCFVPCGWTAQGISSLRLTVSASIDVNVRSITLCCVIMFCGVHFDIFAVTTLAVCLFAMSWNCGWW